jgi:redox-sensitive bicupin YhaK (pirin superfamily)
MTVVPAGNTAGQKPWGAAVSRRTGFVGVTMGKDTRNTGVTVWRRGGHSADSYEGCYSSMRSGGGGRSASDSSTEAIKMEKTILAGRYTVDGAGVKLFRVFANETTKLTDPFLLLDNFGSDRAEDYIRGFPWHPHRGIETVTYMIEGEVEHGDSIGNKGVIGSGDIQWMTAGGGIIHQEMPKPYRGTMRGTQLWVNLPASEKMMGPRYRGITADEVPVANGDGVEVKVIAGGYGGMKGPVTDLVVDVEYFDVSLKKGATFTYPVKQGYTTFCYLLEGKGSFSGSDVAQRQIIVLKKTGSLEVTATEAVRFMLASGRPLNEPIAWGGPIVMNTREELERAFRELDEGTFVKG